MAPPRRSIGSRITGFPLPPVIGVPLSLTLPLWISIYSMAGYYNEYLQSRGWRSENDSVIEEYDFIVGGGSAGSALVNRISEHHSVLLLEIGGYPNPLSYVPYPSNLLQRCHGTDLMYKTVPQNNSCLGLNDNESFWPRGQGLGGSSNLNAMIYQRGNPNDYDNWAKITGNPAWSYDNVMPYFKKLEDYNGIFPNSEFHGKGGPLHVERVRQSYMEKYFLDAAIEMGYKLGDPTARQSECFSPMDVTMKNGRRWSTYPAYIKPILDRKSLTIYRYARAIKIEMDEKNHVNGVTYYRFGKPITARSRKEVILSAGSIDSPKILMLSGIGVPKELQAHGIKPRIDLPVGKNLQDHIFGLLGPILVDAEESLVLDDDANLQALWNFTRRGQGPLATISISATGFVTTSVRNDKTWPEIQFFMNGAGISTGMADTLKRISNVKYDEFNKYVQPYTGKHSNLVLVTLVRPKSIGDIKLASNDPFMHPIIQPNYLTHPDDIKALVEGTKIVVNMYENTKAYKAINARLIPKNLPGCESYVFKTDSYWECVIRHMTFTIYHPVGTCAMGKDASDPRAVVDSELRVLGTTGLRVVDASIMPIIVNANTNVPSIMIGEMGANFILKHWSKLKQG